MAEIMRSNPTAEQFFDMLPNGKSVEFKFNGEFVVATRNPGEVIIKQGGTAIRITSKWTDGDIRPSRNGGTFKTDGFRSFGCVFSSIGGGHSLSDINDLDASKFVELLAKAYEDDPEKRELPETLAEEIVAINTRIANHIANVRALRITRGGGH